MFLGKGRPKAWLAGMTAEALATPGGNSDPAAAPSVQALVTRSDAAHTIAKARAAEARVAREKGLAQMSTEMNDLKTHAEDARIAMQKWTETIAQLDADVQAADVLVKQAEESRERVKEAFRLQQRSSEATANLKKNNEVLRKAQQRYDGSLQAAHSAAEQAAAARAELLREVEYLREPIGNEVMTGLRQSGKAVQEEIMGGEFSMSKALLSLTAATKEGQSFEEQLMWASEVTGPSGRTYGGTLCCLRVSQCPRRQTIRLVEWWMFEPVILATILANCATMAWESPLDPTGTAKAAIMDVCEWLFLVIFTAELVIKMISYGAFSHRNAYFRDSWCRLDFVIVSLAWLPILLPSLGNFSSLRAFRALRPLRALKRVPGMPVLIQWVLDVIPKMGNVILLCGFVMLIFGIVGMELFKGSLHYRCALPSYVPPSLSPPTANGTPPTEVIPAQYDTGISCNVNAPSECAEGSTCGYFATNPKDGILSFDSVALSAIALVEGITFDDWASPMYGLSASLSPYVWVYFVVMVLIGGFFVTNLFLAVIFLEYGHSRSQVKQEEAAAAIQATREQAETAAAENMTLLDPQVVLSDGTMPQDGGGIGGRGFCPCPRFCDCAPMPGWRRILAGAASSNMVSTFTTVLVLVNLVLMCMPFEGMSESYADALEEGASVITWIFIGEMGVKIIAFGCAGYWRDGWNVLDGSIVTMSIVEIITTYMFSGQGVKLSFLRILRMLRVLRILRLMRSWRGLYDILASFGRAIPQMANIFFLLLLAIFMFALMGMQLFGGIYKESNGYSLQSCPGGVCPDGLLEKPHEHFDYCGPAMLTIFILITGEWVEAMDPTAALLGPQVSLFYIPVVLVGKYILMNLLVAVILSEFADTAVDAQAPELIKGDGARDGEDRRDSDEERMVRPSDSELEPDRRPEWPRDYSLLCFEPQHPLRRSMRRLIGRSLFDNVILVAIVLSSICLALDSPRLDPESALAGHLYNLNMFFTFFFVLEMCIKVVAFGFAFGEGTYMSSGWNQLDFVIVFFSILVLLAEEISELRGLRVLRVLRVLRPLRLVSRNAGMKLIITSLFRAMPAVSNVFGVVLSLQVVFAILGMQLFSGEMASCTDPTVLTREACVGVAEDGMPRDWENDAMGSFDNFGDAMRLLYVMSSGDGWASPMYRMMGAYAPGHAPVRNDNSFAAFFAIGWMCVGSIVAINLFVGVVVDNFSRVEKLENGSAIMTLEQQQWVATVKAMVAKQPTKAFRPPDSYLRKLIYRFVESKAFDIIITTAIMSNIGVMACDYWGIESDPRAYKFYTRAMVVFNIVYYVEATLKIIAYGVEYFGDNWCRFDFFLVATTALTDVIEDLLAGQMPLPPMLLRVLRVFRTLRILRLLKKARGLRDLVVTMILSFPALFNVASLLFLIIYIYAILGIQLFTFVSYGELHDPLRSGMNDERNFKTLGSSALLLFQCLTNDGWADLMADAMVIDESGHCSDEAGNCGSVGAVPYFISFQVIGSFVFINLVVAVILENFSTLHNVNPNLVSAADLEFFAEAWAEFDPDATGYVKILDVPPLLLTVMKPLGLKGKSTSQAKRLCMRLNLPQHAGGLVAYHELIKDLVENNYFRSGALDLDEQTFKLVASKKVPQLSTFSKRALPSQQDFVLGESPAAKLQATANNMALSLAYATVADAVLRWRERSRAKRTFNAVPKALISSMNGKSVLLSDDNANLSGALGVAGGVGGLPQLPPGLAVTGGVARLGWLRCNGEKRWIKIGREYSEVWLDNTMPSAEKRYPWTHWAVLSVEYDLKRNEPAMRVELGSTQDRKGRVVLMLEAYVKDSEPNHSDRVGHLSGFLEAFKAHCIKGVTPQPADFGPSPPAGSPIGSSAAAKSVSKSPQKRSAPQDGTGAQRTKQQGGGQLPRSRKLPPGSKPPPAASQEDAPASGRQHWVALGLGQASAVQPQNQSDSDPDGLTRV